MALGCDKDVGRLDIAVHDTLGVGGIQSVRNLDSERDHGLDVQRFSCDSVLQRHTLQKLHRDVGLLTSRSIRNLADVIDGADIWMIESGSGSSFAAETLECLRVLRNVLRKKLKRNETPELSIFRFINNTHATTAQLLDDAITRNSLADHSRESYVAGTGKSMNTERFLNLEGMVGEKSRLHNRRPTPAQRACNSNLGQMRRYSVSVVLRGHLFLTRAPSASYRKGPL